MEYRLIAWYTDGQITKLDFDNYNRAKWEFLYFKENPALAYHLKELALDNSDGVVMDVIYYS
jgi:hypothetical protein